MKFFNLQLLAIILLAFSFKTLSKPNDNQGPALHTIESLQAEVFEMLSPIFSSEFQEPDWLNENDSDDLTNRQITLKFNKILCTSCHFIFKYGGHLPEPAIVALVDLIATTVCVAGRSQKFQVCLGAVTEMVPVIIQGALNKWMDPDLACPKLRFCPKVYEVINMDNYVNEIIKDQPQNQVLPIPTYEKTFHMLHISDLHTDLRYKEGSNAQCGYPNCCREDSGQPQKPEAAAGYWGTPGINGVCDIPQRVVDSMIKYIKNDLKIDVKTGVWTGDNASHEVWNQSKKFNEQNTISITDKLKQNLPGVQWIPVIGNHQSYPVNVYDYHGKREKEFNAVFADIWEDWIGAEAAQQHRDKGFYSTYVQEIGIIAIGINTQACNNENWLLMSDPTDPFGQLAWLREQLINAEQSNIPVYLLSHIPNNSCLNDWGRVFNAIVDRFSYIIRGQFYGHTHHEGFIVFQSHDVFNKAINAQYIQSSVSTMTDHDPEFRLYEIDSETKLLKNYYVYRMLLDEANANPDRSVNPTWEIRYDFLSHYQIPNMWNYELLEKLSIECQTNQDVYERIHAARNITWKGDRKQTLIKNKYWCDFYSLKSERDSCLGISGKDIFQKIMGPWRQKIQTSQKN